MEIFLSCDLSPPVSTRMKSMQSSHDLLEWEELARMFGKLLHNKGCSRTVLLLMEVVHSFGSAQCALPKVAYSSNLAINLSHLQSHMWTFGPEKEACATAP
eukprot:scaffold329_cov390-Pavlova_lutheri.AAC.4